jgi:hypothetical protein
MSGAKFEISHKVNRWSTYINGLQLNFDTFKKEVLQACEHVRSMKNSK